LDMCQPNILAHTNTHHRDAGTFLLSAFCIFFYSLYPTRQKLWTATALVFLTGLFLTITSVVLLFAA